MSYVATTGVCDAIHGIPEYTRGKEPLCGLRVLEGRCLYTGSPAYRIIPAQRNCQRISILQAPFSYSALTRDLLIRFGLQDSNLPVGVMRVTPSTHGQIHVSHSLLILHLLFLFLVLWPIEWRPKGDEILVFAEKEMRRKKFRRVTDIVPSIPGESI